MAEPVRTIDPDVLSNLQHRFLEFRVDNTTDHGEIEGYATAFNVIEPGYDTIMEPGCCDESIGARGPTGIYCLLQHGKQGLISGVDINSIAGDWTFLKPDATGLLARAKLDLELSYMADPWINIKKKRLRGLSLGFREIEGWDEVKDGRTFRHFAKIDIMEISLVVFQGNPGAGINKTRQAAMAKREIEYHLHNVCGLSRSRSAELVAMIDESDLRDAGQPPRDAGLRRDIEDPAMQRLLEDVLRLRDELGAVAMRRSGFGSVQKPLDPFRGTSL